MKTSYANTPLSLHPTTSSVLLPSTPSTTVLGLQSLYSRPKEMRRCRASYSRRAPAFTIVELLIVIVVIGILATISIIAYNGITQKAKNTAIINAASQSLKMIEAYVAQYGEYPAKNAACLTTTENVGCQASVSTNDIVWANATFDTNLAKVGTLPRSVPKEGDKLYGIVYSYHSDVSFNTEPQPAFIRYFLIGRNQKCGLPGVMAYTSVTNAFETSTTGYTNNNDTSLNKTTCYVNIPGPAS